MAKFQIKSILTTPNTNERDEIFNYLVTKLPIAMSERGDSLTLKNNLDGTYTITCSLCVEKQSDQTTINTYLVTKLTSGSVKQILYRHDESSPCEIISEVER